jgi:hypothetical protein
MSVTATAQLPCHNVNINNWRGVMKNFSKVISIGRVIVAGAVISSSPALASTGYDGHWNVQITSNRPNCPSGASFPIAIENGQVASAGGMFNASGRVGDAGIINVVMSSGIKRANGLGHLSAASGSGTWHGDLCSGTWTASRE